MPPLNGIERISLALLGKVFFSDSEDEWVMSDNDDKRQFDKVFASEYTPDDNEYLPTGEVCLFDHNRFYLVSSANNQQWMFRWRVFKERSTTLVKVGDFILVRIPNNYNYLTIVTMIFVIRYSNDLTVNFLARSRAQRCGDDCEGRRGLLCQLLHPHPWPTLVIRMDRMMMTVMTVLALVMTVMTFEWPRSSARWRFSPTWGRWGRLR